MSHQNIIDVGFDVEAISAEQKQVYNLFVDLFGKLKEFDGTKFNPLGNGGLADLKKSFTDSATAMTAWTAKAEEYNKVVVDQAAKQQQNKKSTDETSLAVQQYGKIVDQAAQVQAKANALTSTAAENLAIDKEQLKLRNAELQKSAAFLTAESNSVGEARAANALLTIERDKQNTTTEEGKAKILELNAAIDKNNEIIRENSSLLEKQKINIGNYNGAVGVLQTGLSEIASKLNQFATAGDQTSEAVQKLVLEQQILQVLLDKQSAGFSSVTSELRATKGALDTLTVSGLENTETFEKLNTIYTQSKQKVEELHNEQKILTSESPALTALTAAARGLGGAYALGAGASALFADGNEKVEKELQKLVAVMTFLQGLEEAVKAVKDRGAIATALQATATKALVAIQQIEVAIFGEATAAVETNTVAKTINTESTVGNVGALEAETAGKVANTEVTAGMTVASEAATAATIGFRTALISTGIGAIIIALIYGITKLIGAISDWAGADERAEQTQKALTASTAELLETTKELNEAYRFYYKERIEGLTREGSLQQAAGKNQFITLENERKVNQARLDLAKKYVDSKKIDQKTVDQLYGQQVTALEIVQGAEENLAKAQKAFGEDDSKENKKRVESSQKFLDQQKADTKNIVTEYNIVKDALKDVTDGEAALNETRVKIAKAAADELATITADGAQRRYDSIKAANDRILGLETSTEAQRLAAAKSNYSAEAALAGSQIGAIQKQVDAQTITEQAGADQISNIRNALNIKYRASLDEQVKIRLEFNDRYLAAQNAISKNKTESDASIQEAISKDVQKELDDRLVALKRNIDDKTKIIVDDYNLQLTLAREHGKTEAEIQQLASDRDRALVELTANTQKEIYDITLSYGDRKLKAIEDQNKAIDSANQVTTDYNAQTDSLNTALINQTISYRKYINDKRLLDRQYNIDLDNAQIADDEKRLENIRDLEIKKLNIQEFFAQKALDAAKAGGDQNEIDKAQAKVDALHAIQVKAAADDVAITDKLNKDKQKKNADTVAANLAAEQLADERKKELEMASFNLGVELVDASYENRINAIQGEIDAVDSQAAAETQAVQRSSLSQRDQAAELIIIQANQKAKDTQLRQEQKQEKIKEAHFDQDVAIAKIGWSTAQAVMKDTAGVPWPLSLEIAALDIALGAVQVAAVLANPVPTYGAGVGIPGKGEHAGGFAWTGELYKPELISIPGMDPFVVNRPTLIDLPARTSVLPLSDTDMIADLGGSAMRRGTQWINSWPDNNQWEIVQALDRQTGRLVRAYKQSQKRKADTINIYFDPEWDDYKRKKITGR